MHVAGGFMNSVWRTVFIIPLARTGSVQCAAWQFSYHCYSLGVKILILLHNMFAMFVHRFLLNSQVFFCKK